MGVEILNHTVAQDLFDWKEDCKKTNRFSLLTDEDYRSVTEKYRARMAELKEGVAA